MPKEEDVNSHIGKGLNFKEFYSKNKLAYFTNIPALY